jgi:NADPH:quinone reductase-like Zn-dependent oxidoreductase
MLDWGCRQRGRGQNWLCLKRGGPSHTAWQALFDQAQLKEGQTVVTHGAAGNVEAYAVQLARRAGVRIIATAATDDIQFVRNLGANTVIDYHTRRFEEEVRDADAVINLVGGGNSVLQ